MKILKNKMNNMYEVVDLIFGSVLMAFHSKYEAKQFIQDNIFLFKNAR